MHNTQSSARTYHLASSFCSERELIARIPQEENRRGTSVQKYFRVFCEGLVRNGETVRVLCKRPTTKRSSGCTFIPRGKETVDGISYHYLNTFHLPVIGRVYAALAGFCYYMNPFRCKRSDLVFVDPLCVSLCFGVTLACKLRRIPIIAPVTDLPDYYAYGEQLDKIPLFGKLSNWAREQADGFVMLTEQMNEVCNNRHRPYVVVEGFADESMREQRVDLSGKYPHTVCMYTGGLEARYGLDMLVEGFRKANIPDSELHLYGAGSYVPEIRRIAAEDPRIRFFGTRDNRYVVKEQMKATLLINPRYTSEQFTKFSFPSKNMEYAASGTPLLTTALPGMPPEYNEHVFVLEDETPDGMAKALKTLCSVSKEALYRQGQQTKQWVLDNKSNYVQMQKIIDLANKL